MRLRTTGSPDYGVYSGVRSGVRSGLDSFAGYKPLVANVANWTVDTSDANDEITVPNTTAVSITAVPELESYALMLAGLAGIADVARRCTGGQLQLRMACWTGSCSLRATGQPAGALQTLKRSPIP